MKLINDNGCGWLNQLPKRTNIKNLNEDLKTDYLIIGNNPGNKLEKAKKLNITILNESQFSKLLNSP